MVLAVGSVSARLGSPARLDPRRAFVVEGWSSVVFSTICMVGVNRAFSPCRTSLGQGSARVGDAQAATTQAATTQAATTQAVTAEATRRKMTRYAPRRDVAAREAAPVPAGTQAGQPCPQERARGDACPRICAAVPRGAERRSKQVFSFCRGSPGSLVNVSPAPAQETEDGLELVMRDALSEVLLGGGPTGQTPDLPA
jgi:hypothetical protein